MISIPKKTSGIVKNLYFVSSKDELDKKIIHPEIPSDFLTRGKFSDWQTPRIRLYTSVGDALSGNWLGENLKDSELYVYRAKGIRNESLIKPSITSVPYALVLDEWWYLRNLGLDYLGKIKVISEAGKEIYHYGPRSTKAYVYRWNWEEIGLKSWEKSRLKPKEENNKNGKNMIIRAKRKTFSDSIDKVTRRKLFSDQEEENKERSGKKVAKKIGGSVVAGAGTGALLGAGLSKLTDGAVAKELQKRARSRANKQAMDVLKKLRSGELKGDKAANEVLKVVRNTDLKDNLSRIQGKAQKNMNKKVMAGMAIGAGIAGAGTIAKTLLDKKKKKEEKK